MANQTMMVNQIWFSLLQKMQTLSWHELFHRIEKMDDMQWLEIFCCFISTILLLPPGTVIVKVFRKGYEAVDPPLDLYCLWFISYTHYFFYSLASDDFISAAAAFLGSIFFLTYFTVYMFYHPRDQRVRFYLTCGFLSIIVCLNCVSKYILKYVSGFYGIAAYAAQFLTLVVRKISNVEGPLDLRVSTGNAISAGLLVFYSIKTKDLYGIVYVVGVIVESLEVLLSLLP